MPGRFQFLTSATRLAECPADAVPEVAFLGRSNAGKSSLINTWAGTQIAKTSSTPGKTRLINFFAGADYRMVDFPGYGYAARSGDEQASWAAMIESFLGARGNLCGAVLVMDCRRDWAEDETMLTQFLHRCGQPVVLALTKADKLKQAEKNRVIEKMRSWKRFVAESFLLSNNQVLGTAEIEDYVYKNWVEPRLLGLPRKAKDKP